MNSDQTWPGGQKERATPGRPLLVKTGRDDWIRTSDPLLPKQGVRTREASSRGRSLGLFTRCTIRYIREDSGDNTTA